MLDAGHREAPVNTVETEHVVARLDDVARLTKNVRNYIDRQRSGTVTKDD